MPGSSFPYADLDVGFLLLYSTFPFPILDVIWQGRRVYSRLLARCLDPGIPQRNDYATRPRQIMTIEPMAAAEIDVSGS
jgi:hypothetical protein